MTSDADECEAACRRIMAARAKLVGVPGTHAERARLAAELDTALDLWLIAESFGTVKVPAESAVE